MQRDVILTTTDGLKLSCTMFDCKSPRGIVQIIHGINEHRKRYYNFCVFLQNNGYAVFISDNRGHGESVNDDYPLGHMDGIRSLVQDQKLISDYLKSRYSGVPLCMLAHSFGSCIGRNYLQQYDNEIDSLILSGTVSYVRGVGFGMILGKFLSIFGGKRGHNPILLKLGNQKDDTWVVSDKKILQEFRDDPLCNGFKYTNSAKLTIWESDSELKKYGHYKCLNPNLPILSISGEYDPITGGKRGLRDTVKTLQRIGYSNIRTIVYPDMKHEILNEPDKQIVYEDVLNFIDLCNA